MFDGHPPSGLLIRASDSAGCGSPLNRDERPHPSPLPQEREQTAPEGGQLGSRVLKDVRIPETLIPVPGILTVARYRRHRSQCKSKRVGDTEKFLVSIIFRLALALGWE